MTLPGNEYTRALARQSGHLRAKIAGCGSARLTLNGGRQEWVIDDRSGLLDRLDIAEEEAYRWRSAWWCSENAGVRIRAHELTVRALAMQALWLSFVPSTFLAVCGGVYLVMALGAAVLK